MKRHISHTNSYQLNIRTLSFALLLSLVIAPFAIFPADVAADGPAYTTYYPTANLNDARMLGLAGTPMHTLAGEMIRVKLAAPRDATSFELGIFDGDTGKTATGALAPSAGNWDLGIVQLDYQLFADPKTDGSLLIPVGQWNGNDANSTSGPLWQSSSATMPNNAWWNVTVQTTPDAQAPSGHYFYELHIRLTNPAEYVESGFKLGSTARLSVAAGAWGFVGSYRSPNDGATIYPHWDGASVPEGNFFLDAPTTYDGKWEFYLDLPTSVQSLTMWDGDFDFGNRQGAISSPSRRAVGWCGDTNDLNTPDLLPEWAALGAQMESAVLTGGIPNDNHPSDLYRRAGCVSYTLTDPNGVRYLNANPSSNSEWEQFRITSLPSATAAEADYSPTVAADATTFVRTEELPAGTWKLSVDGLDLANLTFWRLFHNTLGIGSDGQVATPLRPYLVGDTVWYDEDGDGIHDASERGMSGITLNLIDANGAVVDTTQTDAEGNYLFEVLSGQYSVTVAESNFAPGGPLYRGKVTTGSNTITHTVTDQNVMDYDFGYWILGEIGDTVWVDSNGNGIYEPEIGELGIPGASVTLSFDINSDGTIDQTITTTTNAQGQYLFTDLRPGTYTVSVNAATLPTGLRQTYDLDGIATPNTTTGTLSRGEVNLKVDFAYRPTRPAGVGTPGFWKNHPEAWPVARITLGGVTYTKAQAIAIMQLSTKTDMTHQMAQTLIAAKLNVGLGNQASCVSDAIRAADRWLARYPISSGVTGDSAAWREGEPIHLLLDAYNNGRLCAGARG